MKKSKVLFVSVAALLLIVLFIHFMNVTPYQELPSTLNGLELTMEQGVYTTAAEKIGIIIHNHRETEYTGSGGGKFFIEKIFAGNWYRVPLKNNSFTSELIIIPPGETRSMYTAVSDLDAEMRPGQYRALYGGMAVPFKVIE